ncbi:MAG: ABC transporter permease [Streptomyces sp.]|nr:ABC transporter permease [Streptomyces sp.]NUR42413.1 ABC transporter permease [Streptomyces sp.]NUS12715.1 ABC transporter permease [Streptomyces sp.]NUS26534.1 ABC transporter permease [Streptomyces sp.]NUS79824.1 ABC transporter permease [Streptomyces sp.]
MPWKPKPRRPGPRVLPWKPILRQLWLPALVFVVLLVVTAGSTSFYFPPLTEVLAALWHELAHGDLVEDLLFSLRNIVLGLALATAVGVGAGLVIGEVRTLRLATGPLLDFARATPTVGFVPVIILTLGIGSGPKVFLIFLGSVWPILLNTISGVRSIGPAVHETARGYRIPWPLRFRRVILPGALPQILAGVRVALSIAVVLMVVSEIYGSPIGLGNFILRSGSSFHVAETWAGTILIGIVGYALSVLLLLVEHRLLGWYHQRAPRERAPRTLPATSFEKSNGVVV